MGQQALAAKRLDALDTVDKVGGPPPPMSPPVKRFVRVLWKLYEQWERDQQQCETSKDSE
jgi:hypothetical protein